MFKKLLLALAGFSLLTGCGGSGTAPSETSTTQPTIQSATSYVLQSGESSPSNLSTSLISGKTFYWSGQNSAYGSISFPVDANQNPTSGTLSEIAPNAGSAINSWQTAVFGTEMPIISSDGQSVSTFNIVSVASSYYVVSWKLANKSGTQYLRWYFGNSAATDAAAYAGNPSITTTSSSKAAFTTSDFSDKLIYYVSSDGSYQSLVFKADGDLLASNLVKSGTPGTATSTGITWSVTNDKLIFSSGITYGFVSDTNLPSIKYWKVEKTDSFGNKALRAFCYDPAWGLAHAMALGTNIKLGYSF